MEYERVIITKSPSYDGDDYLFRFRGSELPRPDSVKLRNPSADAYLQTKRDAFRTKNTNPDQFLSYTEKRPSLRSLCDLDTLDATIYTVACERANGVDWETCISSVKKMLKKSPSTRRALLRIANPIVEYAGSINAPKDVTCLSMIHFLDHSCKLVFRASDVENELIPDLLTINEFFLLPIYGEKVYDITVYSSTAQGISHFCDTMDKLTRILNARHR